MPVGLFGNVAFEEAVVDLEPGDLIVCFSDGITECANTNEDFWEEEDIMREVLACSGTDVVDRVVECADRFADGAEQSDDMTVVAVRIH